MSNFDRMIEGIKLQDIVVISAKGLYYGCSGTVTNISSGFDTYDHFIVTLPDNKTKLAFLESELEVYCE